MVRTVLPLSLIVLTPFLLLVTKAHAEVSVTQGKSSVNIDVHNSVGGSSDNNSSKDCSTSVKVTVNGETKSYTGSDCDKHINVEANGGDSKIEVDGVTPTVKVESNGGSASIGDSEKAKKMSNEIRQEVKERIEAHKDVIKKKIEDTTPEEKQNFISSLLDQIFSFFTKSKN